MKEIYKIAKKLNLKKQDLILYGNYSAKIKSYKTKDNKSKLILVSALNPTSSGEGKTTISIGLADSLAYLNKKVCLCLREPSMGPVFGVKGGAVGGGNAKIVPEDDINLHFNGDFHAITYLNNLISAYIDNHIYYGNKLNLDENKILFHRCIDINDRALREIEINKEKLKNNKVHNENFVITPASELMSIFCLSKDIDDFEKRCNNILIAYSKENTPIYFYQLNKSDCIKRLMQNAFLPNLVQTLNHTPCLVHGGPFANISLGTSSYESIKTALNLSSYVITEAGFGFDLGGEKFLDIMCRNNGLNPNVIVIVCTIKALKNYEGNSIETGFEFVKYYNKVISKVFNKKCIFVINRFDSDTNDDIHKFVNLCNEYEIPFSVCNSYEKGKLGAINLANKIIEFCNTLNTPLKFAYNLKDDLQTKILDLSKYVYGIQNIKYLDKAKKKISQYGNLLNNLPIVIAKTQYSLTDNKDYLKLPTNENSITITDIELKSGAKFILVKTNKILLMPGLPE